MVSDELKKFVKNNKKRKSVFDDFKDDIFYMIDNDVAQKNIVKHIKSKVKKGTKGLTQPNLSEWLKRHDLKKSKVSEKNFGEVSPLVIQEEISSGNSQQGLSKFEIMMQKNKSDNE